MGGIFYSLFLVVNEMIIKAFFNPVMSIKYKSPHGFDKMIWKLGWNVFSIWKDVTIKQAK